MGIKDVFRTRARPIDGVEASGSDVLPGVGEVGNADGELRNFSKQHKWDPFLETEKLDNIDAAIASGDPEKEAALDESLIQEDSPYYEVRISVPPTDTDMPINTIRAWTIGALMCTIVAACNVLLNMRRAPLTITSTVVQLIAYPIGCGWANVVPAKTFRLFGHELSLNPGPFNVKEHTIITMMTAAGSIASYTIDILLAQEIFYGQHFSWGYQILLTMSTQAMGFGMAGMSRRFLVWPSSMVWPAVLITTTVMYSLHDHRPSDPAQTNGWKIGRYRFFLVVALLTFVWEWVPQVFAQFLQLFMFACWIAPNNVVVNQVFGGQTGLGLLPISFDWNVISGFLLSPLQTPAFAIANVGFGIVIMFIGVIGLAWAGPDYYRYLPLAANQNYDNHAQPYNTSLILNPDYTMNVTAYKEYSPILLGPAFSLSYGMGFAALTATLTHVAVFYGPDIWRRARNVRYEEADIHLKLMRKYKEAPEWWYLVVFAISFGAGMAASIAWSTHLTWYMYILAIAIPAFFMIPIGIIQAITNQQTGLNIVAEMIFGYIFPGRPVAMMLFKSYAYMSTYNGLQYISDMKVGHYMKIPPRSMFAAQAFAVFWLSIVQMAVYNFLRGNIDGICTEDQPQGLTCAYARTFYNASVIWGVIGPRIVFGAGSIYSWINWFWFIGFALPVIQYFIAKRYPRSWVRYVFFPAVFGAAGMIPPATMWYLGQYVIVGLFFNWWIKRRYLGWWSQYTFTLSGALDIGTALCIVVSGIGLGLSSTDFPSWWGNTVPFNNLDALGTAVTKTLDPNSGEIIGPKHW
ncbi:OPT oligopeptide transporter protein-domain-containing protein [Emericellopsis atlantica]|uniref:OPT oligopeptide transporter protein-domain-containing protein n=1 Tax=Emericellopsis atlantica TaxID=2614577 RepID=A0A9P8CKY3_9HYPO|nr:OPT oligopeptide transporter protein-domain-containing protein [Emericellopsis atlantica]KAG9250828.1 OPT oligopeptide transporter protein-domain-containing protein [Emericellopsis atlantica]